MIFERRGLGDGYEDFRAAVLARQAAQSPAGVAAAQARAAELAAAEAADVQAGSVVSTAKRGEVDEYDQLVVLDWPTPSPLALRRVPQEAADAMAARVKANYAQVFGLWHGASPYELHNVKRSIRRSIEQYRTGRPPVSANFSGNPPGWKSDYFQWPGAYYLDLNDSAALDAIARSHVQELKQDAEASQQTALVRAVLTSYALVVVSMVGGAVLAPMIGAQFASAAASAPGVIMRAGEAAARDDWVGFAATLAAAGVNVAALPGGVLSPAAARVSNSAIQAGTAAARGDWAGMGAALGTGALAVAPISPDVSGGLRAASGVVLQGVAIQDRLRQSDLAEERRERHQQEIEAGHRAVAHAVASGGHHAALSEASEHLAGANARAEASLASSSPTPTADGFLSSPLAVGAAALLAAAVLFRR